MLALLSDTMKAVYAAANHDQTLRLRNVREGLLGDDRHGGISGDGFRTFSHHHQLIPGLHFHQRTQSHYGTQQGVVAYHFQQGHSRVDHKCDCLLCHFLLSVSQFAFAYSERPGCRIWRPSGCSLSPLFFTMCSFIKTASSPTPVSRAEPRVHCQLRPITYRCGTGEMPLWCRRFPWVSFASGMAIKSASS